MAGSYFHCLVTKADAPGRVFGWSVEQAGVCSSSSHLAAQAGLTHHLAGRMSSFPSRASLQVEAHSRESSHGNRPVPPPQPSLECRCPQSPSRPKFLEHTVKGLDTRHCRALSLHMPHPAAVESILAHSRPHQSHSIHLVPG